MSPSSVPTISQPAAQRPAGIGTRLRSARIARGLTQGELAGSEYSVAYVSRIESGERTPSPEALAIFAQRLGISPETLTSTVDEHTAFALEQARSDVLRAFDSSDWDAAKSAAERLEQIAATAGDSAARCYALRAHGESLERTGAVEAAIDLYTRAEQVAPATSFEERIEIQVALARAFRTLGDLGHSADLITRAIAEAEPHAAQHPALLARLYTHLTATAYERGDVAYARRAAQQAMEHARASTDRRTLANALWAAAPPMAAADPARALSLIRRAGTLYAELGYDLELGRLYAKLGEVARLCGDADGARAALERAMHLMEDAGSAGDKASPYIELAELEVDAGRHADAATLATEAVAIVAGRNALEEGRARRVLGAALSSQDPEAAERELRAAIELFTSAGAQMETARCFRSLGELLLAQGRTDEALVVFRSGLGVVEGAA